ncbi:Hypothetical_protein [Hexamita inflata]|uniref:Hypothetical_protein n=1 Tax=Hexamita inflata TaxID=28002 RepID=A0AA86RCR1_9EUKA|nr:Hypothetical protein HINF_LOCUS53110 [Hexamita inflata]
MNANLFDTLQFLKYFGGQQPNFMITSMEQQQWDEWCSEMSLTVNTYNDVLIIGMQQRFTSGNLGSVTSVYYPQNVNIIIRNERLLQKQTRFDQFQIIPHQREVRSKTGLLPGQLLLNHKQGFQFLVDMRQQKQKYICKNDIYHELNCKKLQRNHILTHDYFVRQLADKTIDACKVEKSKKLAGTTTELTKSTKLTKEPKYQQK